MVQGDQRSSAQADDAGCQDAVLQGAMLGPTSIFARHKKICGLTHSNSEHLINQQPSRDDTGLQEINYRHLIFNGSPLPTTTSLRSLPILIAHTLAINTIVKMLPGSRLDAAGYFM